MYIYNSVHRPTSASILYFQFVVSCRHYSNTSGSSGGGSVSSLSFSLDSHTAIIPFRDEGCFASTREEEDETNPNDFLSGVAVSPLSGECEVLSIDRSFGSGVFTYSGQRGRRVGAALVEVDPQSYNKALNKLKHRFHNNF